jgi:sigma-E factor negative regulatory protein RseA
MKAKISELMDGEAERHAAAGPLDALKADGEARDTWRSYHLIGDAMRDTRMLSSGFAARVAAKLAAEPTVMAPSRVAPKRQTQRWQVLSAAASLAAIAMVGWLAFAPQEDVMVAKAPQPGLPVKEAALAVEVPPPAAANDYLYAHQGYSPRNSLQGVAPYVRMVSGETGPQRQ